MQTTKAISTIILLAAAAGCGGAYGENAAQGEETGSASSPLTSAQRKAKIAAKYLENNNYQWLGSETSPYADLNPPGGRTLYTGGSIFVGDSTNAAHLVYGTIENKYLALGAQSWKGYPTNDEQDTWYYDGRWNAFEGGASIYYKWGASSAYAVQGWIRDIWSRLGYEAGPLGFPVTDEYQTAAGRASRFENGGIYFKGDLATAGWSEADSTWPVMYRNTAGTHPDPDAPTLSVMLLLNASGWWAVVTGAHWTPGAMVLLYINRPSGYASISTFKVASGTTVRSDGTFSYDQRQSTDEYVPADDCVAVNGVVTIQGREVNGNDSHTAVTVLNRPTGCLRTEDP